MMAPDELATHLKVRLDSYDSMIRKISNYMALATPPPQPIRMHVCHMEDSGGEAYAYDDNVDAAGRAMGKDKKGDGKGKGKGKGEVVGK